MNPCCPRCGQTMRHHIGYRWDDPEGYFCKDCPATIKESLTVRRQPYPGEIDAWHREEHAKAEKAPEGKDLDGSAKRSADASRPETIQVMYRDNGDAAWWSALCVPKVGEYKDGQTFRFDLTKPAEPREAAREWELKGFAYLNGGVHLGVNAGPALELGETIRVREVAPAPAAQPPEDRT